MKMPLFVKVDFRGDGKLGAWWTRDTGYEQFANTTTNISETRLRDTFIAVADEIDPILPDEPILGPKLTRHYRTKAASAKAIEDYCKSPEDAVALIEAIAKTAIPYLRIQY